MNLAVIQHDINEWQTLMLEKNHLAAWWLYQAGFAIRYGDRSLLIDPYLSDSLAKKYKGKTFPNERMMPIPVSPGILTELDWVLCTHRHTDHLDPETLGSISRVSSCRFVVPCAVLDHALESTGLPVERTTIVNAGQIIKLSENISLHPMIIKYNLKLL